MKKYFLIALAAIAVAGCGRNSEVTETERFPVENTDPFYPSTSGPMVSQQLMKLPTGSIRPEGWIRRQLELQKDGLCGHLGEISAWLKKEGNSWLGYPGSKGWEEAPYWLRGYAATAFVLQDKDMMKEAKVWIEAILSSQREDGFFGAEPRIGLKGMPGKKAGFPDYWPNMVILWTLQDYYEFTQDERVFPFMLKYFHYLDAQPVDEIFATYWEHCRAGDNLWTVAWLYARTGEEWLVDFGRKIHQNMASWTEPSSLPNWHNVNIAQGFREPATAYLFDGDSTKLMASYHVQDFVRRTFGQVPGGMFGADENARIGYFDPRQGTETCGFAEQMASDEIMMMITGDPYWAENLEDIAFNSFPAAFMPDYKALRYFTSPNLTVCDSKNHNPSIQNKGPFLSMNPFSSRCCQHNHGFGWPYYAKNLVYATPDRGVAVLLYNACKAIVKVGEGTKLILSEDTHYPFEEEVRFSMELADNSEFPLYLRIPSWCSGASLKVNGKTVARNLTAGKYARILREWKSGDTVCLSLPMHVSTRTWAINKNSVSVDYGPLTLSLEIGEEYSTTDSRQGTVSDSGWQETADPAAWPTYEIRPTTPWNYALDTEASDFKIVRSSWPEDDNPFTLGNVPIHFSARGRLVPSWGYDETGMTEVLPEPWEPRSPVLEDITLVPMGAARLRISAFPPCE